MKLELSIKASYLPNWGVYEGVRELLQNGVDAETELRARLDVRHRGTKLLVENEGAVLPHEALLMGHTTKLDRADLRGKFGEGLKLGVLALVRAGVQVKIRSGSEVWVPSVQRSDKFKADVLVFDIQTGRKDRNRVVVEIDGVDQETWNLMRDCFLFLDKKPADDRVRTTYGSLLLDDKFTGKLYAKGIFVQNDADFTYGYDLDDVEIDRDRKMVSKWDLRWRVNRIWNEALRQRPDLIRSFNLLLDHQKGDVAGFDEYGARTLDKEICQQVADSFVERHGSDAVPVANLGESEDLEHLGRKGVVVGQELRSVLQQVMGSLDEVKENLKKEATTEYSWHDLTADEQTHLRRSIHLLRSVGVDVSLDNFHVVDFRDEGLLGMFQPANDRILIARKVLTDRPLTLRVCVHEVAHRGGGDGSKSHVERVENIWSAIVEALEPS